jgi:hypothetical protein
MFVCCERVRSLKIGNDACLCLMLIVNQCVIINSGKPNQVTSIIGIIYLRYLPSIRCHHGYDLLFTVGNKLKGEIKIYADTVAELFDVNNTAGFMYKERKGIFAKKSKSAGNSNTSLAFQIDHTYIHAYIHTYTNAIPLDMCIIATRLPYRWC